MKKITLGLLFFLTGQLLFAQGPKERSVYEPLEFSTTNFIKYNDFLLNPTFSQVGEDRDYISLYYGSQMAGFDGAPEMYMLNYATKVNENMGAALGAFQQSHGIFTSFGAYVNYAYGIQFSEKVWLSLGANVIYVANGIKEDDLGGVPDPSLKVIEDNSFISVRPGINLKVGKFDVGAYAENVLRYSFSSATKPHEIKRFSGHLMYSTDLGEKSYLKLLARGQAADSLMHFGGNALFGLSNLGYFQVGYDTYEEWTTASIGVGLKITKNITVNYTLGKIMGELDIKPTNHEIMFVYNFQHSAAKKNKETLQVISERMAAQEIELAAVKEDLAANKLRTQALQQRLDSIIAMERSRPSDKIREIETDEPAVDGVKPTLLVSTYNTSKFDQVKPGYYIIANVFVKEKNLVDFVEELKAKNLYPKVFVKKSNGFNYVYLAYYQTLREAVRAARSDMGNTYTADIWVLEIL